MAINLDQITSAKLLGLGNSGICHIGNFFYRKSTIGTTVATIEVNNDLYCLQKRIEKFPLKCLQAE